MSQSLTEVNILSNHKYKQAYTEDRARGGGEGQATAIQEVGY